MADTRTSYDTVAEGYADLVRNSLAEEPYLRAALALFADLVRTAGGGPVADIGCGPGHFTAHLRTLGVDAFGIDLSPAMIDLARRDHPDLRFEVGSMTNLPLADASIAALLASWSLIHIPDNAIPTVLDHFHRVLRPGGLLLAGFHVGNESRLKTQGYGGHPMKIYVHPSANPTRWPFGYATRDSPSKPKCCSTSTKACQERSCSHTANPDSAAIRLALATFNETSSRIRKYRATFDETPAQAVSPKLSPSRSQFSRDP